MWPSQLLRISLFPVDERRQTRWMRDVDPEKNSVDVVGLWTKWPYQPSSQLFLWLSANRARILVKGAIFLQLCLSDLRRPPQILWLYLLPPSLPPFILPLSLFLPCHALTWPSISHRRLSSFSFTLGLSRLSCRRKCLLLNQERIMSFIKPR